MTTPHSRRRFLTTVLAIATAPLIACRAFSKPAVATTPVRKKHGLISCETIFAMGSRPGDWQPVDAQGKLVTAEDPLRPWHTDDGRPVYMRSIQWVDEERGALGGIEQCYANWRKGHGVGDPLSHGPFELKGAFRVVYTGKDPRFAAFKHNPS